MLVLIVDCCNRVRLPSVKNSVATQRGHQRTGPATRRAPEFLATSRNAMKYNDISLPDVDVIGYCTAPDKHEHSPHVGTFHFCRVKPFGALDDFVRPSTVFQRDLRQLASKEKQKLFNLNPDPPMVDISLCVFIIPKIIVEIVQ